MNLPILLQGVGSAGPFSSRGFLSAFLLALLLRFGPQIPAIEHLGLLALVPHHQPIWFTCNACLIVLGVLAIVEQLAHRSPEARQILQEVDSYSNAIVAALSCLGVISATDSSFIHSTVSHAGFGNEIVPILSALATFEMSRLRKQVVVGVLDHLEGTQLDRLIGWLENAWVVFGSLLVVLLPVVMVIMLAAAAGVLLLIRRHLRRVEEQAKVACSSCGAMIYPCAVACPACGQLNPAPFAVGFLGQSKPFPANDAQHQPYRLMEKRRCPRCATHRPPRHATEACSICRNTDAGDPKFADAYAEFISRRVPVVMGVCFLMSLVPIIGLVVAIVYSHMELVLPFRQYLPLSQRFFLRWGLRILFLVLVFFQLVPVLGAFAGPLMAFVSYVAYRQAYLSFMQSRAVDPIVRTAPATA
jgi:hypothetical protein